MEKTPTEPAKNNAINPRESLPSGTDHRRITWLVITDCTQAMEMQQEMGSPSVDQDPRLCTTY